MNASNDPVLDRIESAERMLRQARIEHARGNRDDADEFLAAAHRNITRARETMQQTAPVIDMRDKGRVEAAVRRQEVQHAR